MDPGRPRKIPVVFYRTPAGAEVVRDWLRGLDDGDRNAIGQDLMRVQFRWPVGMPLCRAMGGGLWEVRSDLAGNRIARVLFSVQQGRILVLHGFTRRPEKRPMTISRSPAGVAGNSAYEEGIMKRKKVRLASNLTTLDAFLKTEGKLEEFEAVAIKEVLAWQIGEAMKAQNLSRKRLAERMNTSRSRVSRLLDPKDGNVTIATLQRAARIVGRTLRLELV
jgi:phage-related protein/predicted XRE-type DNA-binding protein